MSLIKCPKCGKEYDEKWRACPACGTFPVNESSSVPTPEPINNNISSNLEQPKSDDVTQNFDAQNTQYSNASTENTGNTPEANSDENKSVLNKKAAKIVVGISAIIIFVIILFSTKIICIHEWQDATCTKPQVCSKCDRTKGKPLGHELEDATCTVPPTCVVCDEAVGEPLGHSWDDATCDSPKTCSRCQETEGEALGHTIEEWKVEKQATCTETGTKGGTCTVCEKYLTETVEKANHTPGEWQITTAATISSDGERSKSCTVCGQVVATEEYELSAEEKKALYINACQTYTYDEISRNPGNYEGKYAKFTGEVIQVMQEEYLGMIIYVMRVDVTKSGRYYTDTVYVTYYALKDAPRILEDDIITMYGELAGEKTYETTMGASVTIPEFDAEYVDIH